jgi:hypothetical protein
MLVCGLMAVGVHAYIRTGIGPYIIHYNTIHADTFQCTQLQQHVCMGYAFENVVDL